MRKRYKLKNKERFYTFLAFIAIVFIGIFLICSTAHSSTVKNYILVKVSKGDTLWDIAEKYGGSKNIRKFIYEIRENNGLMDSTIYEGMTIEIPSE